MKTLLSNSDGRADSRKFQPIRPTPQKRAQQRLKTDQKERLMGKQQVTKGQIGQMVVLMVADKIDYETVQYLIQAHRDMPSGKKRQKVASQTNGVVEDLKHLAYWERLAPNKGMAIMAVLHEVYAWEPKLAHKSFELENLVDPVHFAQGLKIFRFSEMSNVPEVLCKPLGVHLRSSWALTGGHMYFDPFFDAFTLPFATQMRALEEFDSRLSSELGITLNLQESFKAVMEYSLAYQTVQPAIRVLLSLWLKGNFPIGIDKDRNLLVLIAD